MLPQSETERLLEAHLNRLGVTVERETEATAFTDDGGNGPASLSTRLRYKDGRMESATSRWLVGCDGAHSMVRHGLGMDFSGDTMMDDWFLADVHLSGLRSSPDELSLYWHADGILALFPITRDRYRIIADVGTAHRGAGLPDPDLAQVQAVVDRRGPGGIVVSDPVWLSAFRINDRKVNDYRTGGVFLAGDAAHIHSPAGGQGMNTGMQDAFNLAWKLALARQPGIASDLLLDSYSQERSAIGDQVLEAAGRLTAVAVLRNPALQAVRNAVARLALGLAPVRRGMADTLSEVSIGYAHSPLNGNAPHGAPAPGPGERIAPQQGETPIGADSRPFFVLFADDAPQAHELVGRHPALLDPTVRPPLAQGGIWLARPDGYVAQSAPRGGWDAIGLYLDNLVAGQPLV
jgi:2-polyprenyl-6-methoxyphenol hydroxylase-like FAD-dependent oxidoreductase